MRYFCVRHKLTQRLLPQTFQTGSTWWTPDDPEYKVEKNELPRLFASHKAAKGFVIAWAKGHAVKQRQGGNSISIFGDTDYAEWLEWEEVPGRARDQLEVIPVYLQFGEPL